MEEKIYAAVGEKEITEQDLERIRRNYPMEKRIYFETAAGQKQLLEQKIAFTLFGIYAKECGKDKEKSHIEHMNDLEEQILTQGVMKEWFEGVSVSEQEAMDYYEKHPEKFQFEETVRASHILVDTEAEAKKIYLELEQGFVTFEAAAEKYSKCPSREKGGDLGYFKRGMMVKEFEEAAFAMPLHRCSGPVKSQFGYHLIKTADKTESGRIEFLDVATKLKEELLALKQQEIYEKKLEELKQKYQLCVTDWEEK